MLISLLEQQAIKPISPNWANHVKVSGGVTNFVQLATEVEVKEFRILLGIDFYSDLITNQVETRYVNLIEGTSFVNCRNNTVSFNGLKYILAFMNYSKYVGESFVSDTFTGMVRKNRDESESLSTGDIKRLQLDAREIALQDFELIKEFLDKNNTIYPLWNYHYSKKAYIPKFTGIKKTLT